MGRCLTPGLESVQCPWRTMSNSNEVEIKPLEAAPLYFSEIMGMEVTLSKTSMNELVERLAVLTKKLVLDELDKRQVSAPKTMTVKEVAQLLHLSEWTVRQRKEEFGAIKVSDHKSGKLVFPTSFIMEYMNKGFSAN